MLTKSLTRILFTLNYSPSPSRINSTSHQHDLILSQSNKHFHPLSNGQYPNKKLSSLEFHVLSFYVTADKTNIHSFVAFTSPKKKYVFGNKTFKFVYYLTSTWVCSFTVPLITIFSVIKNKPYNFSVLKKGVFALNNVEFTIS